MMVSGSAEEGRDLAKAPDLTFGIPDCQGRFLNQHNKTSNLARVAPL